MILPVRINTNVQRGTAGGPTAARRMIYNGRGELSRQQHLRPYPVHRYTFDFGKKLLAEAHEVRDVFYVVLFGDGGPYDGFLARDWNDFVLTQDNSIVVQNEAGDWQLCRLHRVGAYSYARPVYRPAFDGTTTIFTEGGIDTGATVDVDTGIVTGSLTEGAVYTAEGEFDIALTFENDDDFSRIALGGTPEIIFQSLGSISLVEVIPEEE
jgi:uncharacterized protein (TIGR02217 family)